jgi:hypothetical protein
MTLRGLSAFGLVAALGLGAPLSHAQPADPIGGLLQGVAPARGGTSTPAAESSAPPGVVVEPVPTDPTEAKLSGSGSNRRVYEVPKRKRYAVAVMQVLDKVTAETLRFEVPINQPIRYKSLIFSVRTCETSASDEPVRDAFAHVQIDSQSTRGSDRAITPGRQLFRGWMFASTPGLNPFQHPVYDAWLIACKTSAPAA